MAKGSYSVGNQQPQSQKDSSFRSFICSLLIFLALCIILLLATIKWTDKTPKEFQQKAEKNVKEDVEVFNVNDKNNNSDRIVVITATEKVPDSTINPPIKTAIRQEIDETSVSSEKESVDIESTKRTTLTTAAKTFGPTTTTSTTTPILGPNKEKSTTEGRFEKTTESTDSVTDKQEAATLKASTTTKLSTADILETTISRASAETETTTEENGTTSPLPTEEESSTTRWFISRTISPLLLAFLTTKKENLTTTPIFSSTKSPLVSVFSTTENENPTVAQTSTDESLLTTDEDNSISTLTSPLSSSDPEPEPLLTTASAAKLNNPIVSPTRPPSTSPSSSTTTWMISVLNSTTSSTRPPSTSQSPSTTTWMISVSNSTTSSTRPPLTPLSSSTTTWMSSVPNSTISSTRPPTSSTTVSSFTTGEDNFTSSAIESSTVPLSKTTSTTPSSFTAKTTTPQNLMVAKTEICTTSACNQTASRMLNLMKHSVGPCEDFYEFACGGGEHALSNNLEKSINEALLSYLINIDNSSSERYYQNFNNFYTSCVKHEDFFKYDERIKTVKKLVGDVGQFEDITNVQQSYNITDLFAKLLLRQSLPFFHFALDIDQNSTFILQLTVPERGSLQSGLKDWSNLYWHHQNCLHKQKLKMFDNYLDLNLIYESLESCRSNYSNYLDSIEETIRQLGVFDHLNSAQFLKEIKELRFTIEFDILNLIAHFPTPSDIEQAYVDKNYDHKTIGDLQATFPNIDWKELLQTLTDYDFGADDQIQVYFWHQFTQIFGSLARVKPRGLNNALLAIYADNLYQNTIIPKSKTHRDLYCLDLTKQLLPDVAFFTIQTLFVERIENGQRSIGDLFDLLKRQFQKSLLERDWLYENSTTILMEQFMKIHADYPINFDKQILDDNHRRVVIGDDYQENLIALIIHRKKTIWRLVTVPSSAQLLYLNFLEPLAVEPLTVQQNGRIVIPFGLLYKFQPNIPSYLSVSSIGLHLSRAIVRNFDKDFMEKAISPDEMDYYSYLLLNTEEQIMYFSPRIFEQRNITFKLNGSISVNERIVDNAAFRLVLDTLTNSSSDGKLLPWISDSYSRIKIVFISAAQEYCERSTILDFMLQVFETHNLPAPLKIQNIIGNSESFIANFKCAEGAGMNLIEEKLQFPYLLNKDDPSQSLSYN